MQARHAETCNPPMTHAMPSPSSHPRRRLIQSAIQQSYMLAMTTSSATLPRSRPRAVRISCTKLRDLSSAKIVSPCHKQVGSQTGVWAGGKAALDEGPFSSDNMQGSWPSRRKHPKICGELELLLDQWLTKALDHDHRGRWCGEVRRPTHTCMRSYIAQPVVFPYTTVSAHGRRPSGSSGRFRGKLRGLRLMLAAQYVQAAAIASNRRRVRRPSASKSQ